MPDPGGGTGGQVIFFSKIKLSCSTYLHFVKSLSRAIFRNGDYLCQVIGILDFIFPLCSYINPPPPLQTKL